MIEDKNGGVLDSMEDEGIHQDEEDEATYKGQLLLCCSFQNIFSADIKCTILRLKPVFLT